MKTILPMGIVLFVAFGCTKPLDPGQESPVAAKAQDDSLFDLFGSFDSQADSAKSTERPDTTVTNSGPDVVIDTLWASIDRGAPGSLFTLWTRVHNQGNAIADSLTVRFYLSNNTTITPGDDELASLPIASLSSGEQDTLEVELALSTRDVSINFFGACVDSVVGEQATDNNCSLQAQTVRIEIEGEAQADDTEATETEETETEQGDDPSQRFNITLAFRPEVPQKARLIIRRAARRWEEVIVGDVPDFITKEPYVDTYGDTIPSGSLIDDLYIKVYKEKGTSLAGAGPFGGWREHDYGTIKGVDPRDWWGIAWIFFDFDEFKNYKNWESTMYFLALHEIGHTVGLLPSYTYRVTANNTGTSSCTISPNNCPQGTRQFITGPNAIAQFKRLLGGAIWDKPGVPTSSPLDIHWDEKVLGEDVMASWSPLISTVSAGLLQDMGYTVDMSKTDPITVYPQNYAGKRVAAQLPPHWCGTGKH